MKDRQKLNLLIDHIDPLGQGVAKVHENIYFVPKTLPNENVEVEILHKKKQIHFAQLNKVLKESDLRIPSFCPHYGQCPSCHFQHTTYQNEIEIKKSILTRAFRKLSFKHFELITSDRRDNYRNRIQLHYSLKHKLMGYQLRSGKILPIEQCPIANVSIQKYLKTFLKTWPDLIDKSEPQNGHVEIYALNEQIRLSWNQSYAAGGFTQVYSEMNIKMHQLISDKLGHKKFNFILDLFGGNGNISNELNFEKRLIVDGHPFNHPEFMHLNLYESDALKNITSRLNQDKVELLILDPPRSGHKDLASWVKILSPNNILYISCNHQTLIRDLEQLELNKYNIETLGLLDFFPSTYHFETLVILNRK